MTKENRRCDQCLLKAEYLDKGLPTVYCKMGRRVFVAKPCSDELIKGDGGGRFINDDDRRELDDKLLGC